VCVCVVFMYIALFYMYKNYPSKRVDGKVALVTGASSGMGEQVARLLAKRGCSVGLVARNALNLEKIAREIRDEGKVAKSYPADAADPRQVAIVSRAFLTDFGAPDFIIHCAGAGSWEFIEDTTFVCCFLLL
jgi:short-subunit dehydrogenase